MGRGEGGPSGRLRTLLGDGVTVVVRGPAGIGKSTLVRNALRTTPFRLGQSLEPLAGLPYHPLSHALARAFAGAPTEVAAEVAAELAERTLVIEDAHWSDSSTLDVLVELAGHVPLVVTTRSRLTLDATPGVAVVEVPPLQPTAADALARRLHPDLDLKSRVRLVEQAGGNPLLIGQLVSNDVVSPTLVDAVRSRVAALPAVTVEQLAIVALHRSPLRRDLLAAASGADVVDAGALLIEGDDGVTLTHALLADALIELVDDGTRRRLHQRLADVCDDADAARHLAAAGDHEAAAERAERAAATVSSAEQAQLLALAVESRGTAASARLRLDAAAALIAANQPATAEAVVAPLTDGDRASLAEAGWYRSQAAWLAGDEALADRRCTEALTLVEGSGEPVETRLLVELVTQRVRTRIGDPTVIEDAQRAWAAASAAGIDRAKARSLMGLTLSHNGRPGWEEHYLAAAEIAREDGDVEQELMAMYWLVSAYGFYGPLHKAMDRAAAMIAVTERLGLRRLHHHFLGAYLVHRFGTGTASDELVGRARRLLVDDPLFRNRAQIDLVLAIALIDRGDCSGARTVLDTGRRFARNDEDRSLMCVGQAELAWATGDRRALSGALNELASCTRGFFGMNAFAESAAIHMLLEEPGEQTIPTFSVSLMPVVDVVGVERAAFESWQRGDAAGAIGGFDEAARQWTQRSFVRFGARAQYTAGRLARATGDVDAAARRFAAAGELASRWRLAPIARAAREACGELAREARRSRLTRREVEVLELVAAGRTSRQIAAVLRVGESTVVTHVNSARLKLGAQTRMQAASMVAGDVP